MALNAAKINAVSDLPCLNAATILCLRPSHHRASPLVTTMNRPAAIRSIPTVFVLCSNVIRRLHGLDRPARTRPATAPALCLNLPLVTVRDMVRSQNRLIEHL